MKKIVFSDCNSVEDIKTTIEKALEYDNIVENDEAARQWFKEAGIEGEVTTHVIISTHVSVRDDEHQGEVRYSVVIKEHFTDAGSVDYVYSYKVY